jgi:hypothetical protein
VSSKNSNLNYGEFEENASETPQESREQAANSADPIADYRRLLAALDDNL